MSFKIFRKELLFTNGIMEKSNAAIIKDTEHLIYAILTGGYRKVCSICKNNVLWKYNHSYGRGTINIKTLLNLNKVTEPSEVTKIEHIEYYIQRLSHGYIIITGIYCIHTSVDKGNKRNYFDYTIIFSGGLACYIHIIRNNIPTKIHKVVSIVETVYNIQEDEILYIEAMGGHVLWHCFGITIESVGSLKNIGIKMSEDFVKVHRSYIANRKCVRSVQRCSVTMINDDVIPVPYKKYVKVRNELLKE